MPFHAAGAHLGLGGPSVSVCTGHLDQWLANYSPWTKSGPPPVSVNASFVAIQPYPIISSCPWLLSHRKGRVE